MALLQRFNFSYMIVYMLHFKDGVLSIELFIHTLLD